MTSTDILIRELSADLTPVARRNVSREAGTVLALSAAELALVLLVHGPRPDMGRVILAPFMIWKIASLALLAGMSCAVAMRSFAPQPSSQQGLLTLLSAAALAIAAGVSVTPLADNGRPLVERLAPAHGLLCATSIVVLALPLAALLAALMRRAAPVRPRQSALAAGLAASTFGALVFTACCPMNDPLYIVVWYSIGVAAVAAAARWLLPWRFRL
jgi:hypothetical protein